jgi:hypothetical protein
MLFHASVNIDELVKNQNSALLVIPSKEGIQDLKNWTPAFARVTGFLTFFETSMFILIIEEEQFFVNRNPRSMIGIDKKKAFL